MSSSFEASWVDAIGYRHEVVHTGVLRQLLSIPGGPGAEVAEALFGLASGSVARDGCCFDDDGPATEVRIGQSRERADLGGWLRLAEGGGRTWVLVETKVDSSGSRAQLDATAQNSDVSVLLAVGCAAFARSAADLQSDVDAGLLSLPPVDRPNQYPAPFASGAREWIVHTPASWLDIIAPHAAAASWLPPYVEAVREQADAHTGARLVAEQGWASAAMRGRSWRAKLHRMALAAAVREGLSQLALPGDRDPGLGQWNAEIFNDADTTRLQVFPPGWCRTDGHEVQLQLRLGVHAELRLSAGGGAVNVRIADEAIDDEIVEHAGLLRRQRRTGDTNSATLATRDVSKESPGGMAAAIKTAADAIDGSIRGRIG